MQFIAVLLTFDPVDLLLHVVKITHQMLVMLTKILRLQIFFSIYISMLCMLCYVCIDSQTTEYMIHIDTS